MKRLALNMLLGAAALSALAATAGADVVLYNFDTGAQGWSSFGPATTDSGNAMPGSAGTFLSRYHTGDFSLGGWGMVDFSPAGIDLTPFTGLSVDLAWDVPPGLQGGQVPYTGPAEVEFMIAVGNNEWFVTLPLTNSYQTYSVDFVDLTPGYYAAQAPYSGALPALNDPNLVIQLVTRNTGGNEGVLRLHYDQITGIVPEPMTAALLGLGGVALLRRRRFAA